ncbi:MAG TPA: DUF1376 domain-containing protein [Longimicrobiaceae bacterium]|nr:DUF1376 domain-containing protein [Longimicrobiaceae bacterium]
MKRSGLWWWIDRWRRSSAYMDMTLAQQGAYRNLLDEYRLRGGTLPNDERVLAKACGDPLEWPAVRDVVMKKFVLEDGVWKHRTADEVNGVSDILSDAQAEKGRKRAADAVRLGGRFTSPTSREASRPPADEPAAEPASVAVSVAVTGSVTGRTEGRNGHLPPVLPPADRTETAIRKTADAMRSKLYGLIDEMRQVDPKGRDPTELMRMVTGYRKSDGTEVKGVVNAALLSFERLEKSIADAEANLLDWRSK